jgi:Protein of unknown function (DUF2842)
MNQRQRRFVGILAMIAFLTIYALVAMAVAGDLVVGRGILVELPVFALLGIAWLPVAAWLIRWTAKP